MTLAQPNIIEKMSSSTKTHRIACRYLKFKKTLMPRCIQITIVTACRSTAVSYVALTVTPRILTAGIQVNSHTKSSKKQPVESSATVGWIRWCLSFDNWIVNVFVQLLKEKNIK